MNGVMIQFFHWYHPGNLWDEFVKNAHELKNLGFTAVWFPPAMKCAAGKEGRGYDVYDLYDLGEFDQKGSVATRYGTKQQYLDAIKKAHRSGLYVYADIVLNHRLGADESEKIMVQQVNDENRNETIGRSFEGKAHVKFIFPGRKGKYSQFIWDHRCFSGVDRIRKDAAYKKGIFKIHNEYGTGWNVKVSHEFGNYDYLMGADVEFRNPFVVDELKDWIKWFIEKTKVNGLRLDALKHISSDFVKDFIGYIKTEIDNDMFFVGEYWKGEVAPMSEFSTKMNYQLSLFDVPLHFNFFEASKKAAEYNLSDVFEGTMLKDHPSLAVTFVGNHDTQRLQALESSVEDWFRPIAYAMILLSKNGYPCVFYPDLYGAEYTDMDKDGHDVKVTMRKIEILPKLLEARQRFAYGEQIDYFDHSNCIAFIRQGTAQKQGCVVIISNSEEGHKEMFLGEDYAGATFVDFLEIRNDEVFLNEKGYGNFLVNPRSVSVWVVK